MNDNAEPPVFLVAFQEQANLGVGYLGSTLLEAGFRIKILDVRLGPEAILEQIRRHDPQLVGFSVIFQYHILEFRNLIDYLRTNGVDCHFCAGGHYPSLRWAELFALVPGLDSIGLFEGERTFLELARAVRDTRDWCSIQGLAYWQNGRAVANPLRPLEEDLDRFPPPLRPPLKEYARGRKYATLLAGRGCVYDCAFCSIRQFYSRPPGRVKRVRRPEMVVREMELLREQMGCSIFIFQDDDFPVRQGRDRPWIDDFCRLLDEKRMSGEILWKINCRPDEVSRDTFERMRDRGLFLVYLGIESGTDEGLMRMNKHIDAGTNARAVAALKDLDIDFDYGFMLFDPDSSFASVQKNLDFLEEICADGSSPVTFCKMLPYAETQIEARLREQGRLVGNVGFEDYRFYDPRLDDLYSCITDVFRKWIGDHEGVLNLSRWARYNTAVYRRSGGDPLEATRLSSAVRRLVAEGNRFVLDRLRDLCSLYSSGAGRDGVTDGFRRRVAETEERHSRNLDALIAEVEKLPPATGESADAAISHFTQPERRALIDSEPAEPAASPLGTGTSATGEPLSHLARCAESLTRERS